jgi:hypothetical protein
LYLHVGVHYIPKCIGIFKLFKRFFASQRFCAVLKDITTAEVEKNKIDRANACRIIDNMEESQNLSELSFNLAWTLMDFFFQVSQGI